MGTKGLFIVDDEGKQVNSIDIEMSYEDAARLIQSADEMIGRDTRVSLMMNSGQYLHLHVNNPYTLNRLTSRLDLINSTGDQDGLYDDFTKTMRNHVSKTIGAFKKQHGKNIRLIAIECRLVYQQE